MLQFILKSSFLKEDSNTGVFLWILLNLWEQLFSKEHSVGCFCPFSTKFLFAFKLSSILEYLIRLKWRGSCYKMGWTNFMSRRLQLHCIAKIKFELFSRQFAISEITIHFSKREPLLLLALRSSVSSLYSIKLNFGMS